LEGYISNLDSISDTFVKIKLAANKICRLFLGEIPNDFSGPRCVYLVQRLPFQIVDYETSYSRRQKLPILILVVDHRAGLLLTVVEFDGLAGPRVRQVVRQAQGRRHERIDERAHERFIRVPFLIRPFIRLPLWTKLWLVVVGGSSGKRVAVNGYMAAGKNDADNLSLRANKFVAVSLRDKSSLFAIGGPVIDAKLGLVAIP